MTYRRYPEKPQIRYRNSEVDIAYNGIKLRFSTTQNPKFYKIDLLTLEDKLSGKVEEQRLQLKKSEKRVLDNLPIMNANAVAYLLEVVSSRANWFTDQDKREMEGLITRAIVNKGQQEQELPRYSKGQNPNKAYLEAQRRRFRDGWMMIFRDNITDQATIDQLLGN